MKLNGLKKERIEEAADRPSNNYAVYTTDKSNIQSFEMQTKCHIIICILISKLNYLKHRQLECSMSTCQVQL